MRCARVFAGWDIFTSIHRPQFLGHIEQDVGRPECRNAHERFARVGWQMEAELVQQQHEGRIQMDDALFAVPRHHRYGLTFHCV